MFARPMSVHRTSGTGSSSSPLLKTPTANLAVNGGSQHPDKRKAGGHGPTLADEVEHLLPTPAARDGRSGKSNLMDRNARPLNEVVVNLLPTPTAADSERQSAAYGRGNPTLSGAITVPRSSGGKRSSGAPLPGQLTLWDG
ncbi:hypothetical protein [Streptomyces sp. NRRL S-448]|uniref:hypothetical protein n=1 Tax=Streptomyces sp. NRRL S-448 TaxID=1463907 RepID=UPI000A4E9B44